MFPTVSGISAKLVNKLRTIHSVDLFIQSASLPVNSLNSTTKTKYATSLSLSSTTTNRYGHDNSNLMSLVAQFLLVRGHNQSDPHLSEFPTIKNYESSIVLEVPQIQKTPVIGTNSLEVTGPPALSLGPNPRADMPLPPVLLPLAPDIPLPIPRKPAPPVVTDSYHVNFVT